MASLPATGHRGVLPVHSQRQRVEAAAAHVGQIFITTWMDVMGQRQWTMSALSAVQHQAIVPEDTFCGQRAQALKCTTFPTALRATHASVVRAECTTSTTANVTETVAGAFVPKAATITATGMAFAIRPLVFAHVSTAGVPPAMLHFTKLQTVRSVSVRRRQHGLMSYV